MDSKPSLYKRTIREAKRKVLLEALRSSDTVREAAEMLGITTRTIYLECRNIGIVAEELVRAGRVFRAKTRAAEEIAVSEPHPEETPISENEISTDFFPLDRGGVLEDAPAFSLEEVSENRPVNEEKE